MAAIFPVIMSGGSGTRLWPLSRKALPKQYLDLVGEGSLFRQTVSRMSASEAGRDTGEINAPLIICGASHRDPIRNQLEESGIDGVEFILEPFGKNTAVVGCIAALHTLAKDLDGLVLLAPADHYIPDVPGFWSAVAAGEPAAQSGQIVTLGIKPTKPHTGFGYIKAGAAIDGRCHKVDRFEEKPKLPKAEAFLASGDYYWNAGIFLYSAAAMIEELAKHAPKVLEVGRAAYEAIERDGDDLPLPAEIFSDCPDIS
ncbi:MAG: mannose-1-phosphate guanylyltransferase, partial [Pseudomonadota bacterium]